MPVMEMQRETPWCEVVDERWREISEQLTTNASERSAIFLGWKMTRCRGCEQSRDEHFPKILLALSLCRIASYVGGVIVERRKNPNSIRYVLVLFERLFT